VRIDCTLGGEPVTIYYDRAPEGANSTDGQLLGLDVESTYMGDQAQWGDDFRVRTVQFGTRSVAWVMPTGDPMNDLTIRSVLTDSGTSFASHTNMDVLAVWSEFGIDISGRNVDTRMLATQADPSREDTRELKELATRYGMPELEEGETELHALFLEMWVRDAEITGGKRNAKRADIHAYGWNNVPTDNPVFVKYAGLDAIVARRMVDILVPETQAPAKLLEVDQWLHVRSNRIQIRGLRLDRPAAEVLNAAETDAVGKAKDTAQALTGGVNVNGPKVLDWLAEHGADWDEWPGNRTPKGQPSLSKENLLLVGDYPLDEVGRQVFDLMVEQQKHRDVATKTTEILRRAVRHSDGTWRIHPLLNPVGAATTARMSSSGPNVQNFSKRNPRLRMLMLPDPGHILATIDFAQIELRVVAALAREDKMIDTIKAGGDLHQLTVDELASMGVTITRDQAKIVNFLIVYGGGASALHAQTGIPLEESKVIIDAWRERYASISALSKYLGYEHDAVRTISNRRLPVTRNKFGDLRTYANINYAVQSGARELLVEAWRRFELTYGHEGIVWWPIHDELVLQVLEDPEAHRPILADAKRAMTMDFRGVPIEADAVVLRDREGQSRWMTGKLAEQIAKEAAA